MGCGRGGEVASDPYDSNTIFEASIFFSRRRREADGGRAGVRETNVGRAKEVWYPRRDRWLGRERDGARVE